MRRPVDLACRCGAAQGTRTKTR